MKPRSIFTALALALLLLPSLACGGLTTTTGQSAGERTVEVTRIAEVTRVVEVVVTATPKAGPTATEVPPATPTPGSPQYDITNVDSRITETNDVWWKYAWIVMIQSQSDHRLLVNVKVEFVDADGFIVDDDLQYGILVEPWETKEVSGYTLVDSSVAANVASVKAASQLTDYESVAPTASQPSPTIAPMPTTGTSEPTAASPADSPTPTAAPAVDTPNPVPAVTTGVVTSTANRRSGPGTTFDVTGRAETGERLTIVERSPDGAWYKLPEGDWIFAELVELEELPGASSDAAPASTSSALAAFQPAGVSTLNRYMMGNAQPPLPPPGDKDFDVIEIERHTSGPSTALYLFVRNNTNSPVMRMTVTATASKPDGSLLGVEDSTLFEPHVLLPGEITIGWVFFFNTVFPTDAVFSFEASARQINATATDGDMTIVQHNLVDNRFVGMLRNDGTINSIGKAQVHVACFNEAGKYIGAYTEIVPGNSPALGEEVPFQVTLGGACPRYLMYATG